MLHANATIGAAFYCSRICVFPYWVTALQIDRFVENVKSKGSQMTMYLALFRIRFVNALQYRAAAVAGVVTQFAFGFIFISMYLAFYRTNPSAFPMEISQVISYIWVQQAFIMLFVTWFFDMDIFAAISSGQIAYELARPMNLYGKWFCQCVASRVSRAVLRCLPILIIAFILPEPYKLILPPDAVQLLLFIISSVLTLGVVVSFSMLIYVATFYTLSPLGMRIIGAMTADFMAGSIIPLPFFPDGFRQVAELLPFAAMQNIPLRIYSGNIFGIDAILGILFQMFWLVVLFVIGRAWMHNTLKKVIVQGG
jgi:ABC-2 type transport system permease protein